MAGDRDDMPTSADPLTQVLITNARILEKMDALTITKQIEHERMARDINRVETEHGVRITNLENTTQAMKVSMAKAAGMAAVIAVILSTLITVGLSRLLEML